MSALKAIRPEERLPYAGRFPGRPAKTELPLHALSLQSHY